MQLCKEDCVGGEGQVMAMPYENKYVAQGLGSGIPFLNGHLCALMEADNNCQWH